MGTVSRGLMKYKEHHVPEPGAALSSGGGSSSSRLQNDVTQEPQLPAALGLAAPAIVRKNEAKPAAKRKRTASKLAADSWVRVLSKKTPSEEKPAQVLQLIDSRAMSRPAMIKAKAKATSSNLRNGK